MAVFANAGEAHIDCLLADPFADACDLGRQVGCVAIDGNELDLRANLLDEALAEITTEAGRMSRGDTDIFVEVKHGDLGPVDVLGDQGLEHRELAGARSQNDGGPAVFSDRILDGLCPFGGSGSTQRLSAVKYANIHSSPF